MRSDFKSDLYLVFISYYCVVLVDGEMPCAECGIYFFQTSFWFIVGPQTIIHCRDLSFLVI